ncbi:MAG: hypothetical protein J6W13_08695 [Salinivirgaceae bacterium]|nr:hypothetical protein [Salinivirgaceae bacterium]
MKRIILPLVIMSIIAVFTACGWYNPDKGYYQYNNTIILIKKNHPIDTLYDSSIFELDIDAYRPNFTSDTFYFSKEYLLNQKHIGDWVLSAFIDSALSEHLRHLLLVNNDLHYAFYTRLEYETIKVSDCDSIAVSYSGFSEHYKLNKKHK